MFGRVNRMVVIGRCVFWAKAAADAAAGVVKRSNHRCDGLHAALMAWSVLQSVCCSLLVKLLRGLLRGVAALRDTATVLQCSMRSQNDSLTDSCCSLHS